MDELFKHFLPNHSWQGVSNPSHFPDNCETNGEKEVKNAPQNSTEEKTTE